MYHKLESLRGVAACLVILFHSPFAFSNQSTAFVANCYLFVDFFFILSGFVMSHAYGEKIGRGLGFTDYIALRLGRVYPLHLFMLLVWVPFVLAKQYLYVQGYGGRDQFDDNNLVTFVANLFMLHSAGFTDVLSWNQPSWSISAELFAYVAFYLLTCLLDRQGRLYVPILVVVICYAFLLRLDRPDFDITYDYGFIRCLGAFYLGVLVFRLRPHLIAWLQRAPMRPLEILAVVLMVGSVTFTAGSEIMLVGTLLSFCLALLVFSSEQSGWVGRALHNGLMRRIGLWSYSIYMVHKIVVVATSNVLEFGFKVPVKEALGMWSLPLNLLLVAMTIALSRLTYVHVEKRCRDLVRQRLASYRGVEQPAA